MKATYCFLFLLLFSCGQEPASKRTAAAEQATAKPVNDSRMVRGNGIKVLKSLNLVDVVAGEVHNDLTVIVKDDRIWSVGSTHEVEVPQDAELFSLEGKFLMPGLIDSHFHLDKLFGLPHMYLKNGITSVRDPGAWIEAYDQEMERGEALPRLFLTGPHFDTSPPAHPHDAVIVRDEEEARRYVNKFADQGSTAIKVYYRLPLGTIKAVCDEAHKRGLMVTSHLEISYASDVIRIGVDGIEHVTSLGMELIAPRDAEAYRQRMLLDNNVRRLGRYEMWKDIDLEGASAASLFSLMAEEQTFFNPTLAVFEVAEEDSVRYSGYLKMLECTRLASKAGVPIVVGSHSYVPYSEYGKAYQRELELLSVSGMTNAEILRAATITNARFLQVEKELGTIEEGKIADLIVLDHNPLEDIGHVSSISGLMLNGHWVSLEE